MDPAKIQLLAAWAIPILFAITIHEVAHGWVARYFGDDTAARLGRLSLNPMKHVDPVGTVLVPAIMWLFSPFILGWAKPVPVVASKMRKPRQNMAIVALAGPAANFVMALFWLAVLKLVIANGMQGPIAGFAVAMSKGGVLINVVLMLLNLMPIPPLDGSRVLNGVLSEKYARTVDRLERYGLLIVFVVLLVAWKQGVLFIPVIVVSGVLMAAFGLPLGILFS